MAFDIAPHLMGKHPQLECMQFFDAIKAFRANDEDFLLAFAESWACVRYSRWIFENDLGKEIR